MTGRDATVVGLLAPPGLPAQIAEELAAKQLPKRLAERLDGDRPWDVRIDELSLTDLPFGVDGRPVVADAISTARRRRNGAAERVPGGRARRA